MIYCAHTVKLRSIGKLAPRSPIKDNIESLVGTGSSSPYISLSRSCSYSDTAAASFHYWITSKLYHTRRQKRLSYPYECLRACFIMVILPSVPVLFLRSLSSGCRIYKRCCASIFLILRRRQGKLNEQNSYPNVNPPSLKMLCLYFYHSMLGIALFKKNSWLLSLNRIECCML